MPAPRKSSLAKDFYSARLLYVIMVHEGTARRRNLHDESVIVFRAKDFQDAFQRALELGRAQETEYKNGKGQKVRWVLAEITTLDFIGRKIDGKEVSSRLHDRVGRKRISSGQKFRPERSKPNNSF